MISGADTGARAHARPHKKIWPGRPSPWGATWAPDATNFAVFAPEATGVELCLFTGDAEIRHRLTERTAGVWHCAIPDVRPGQCYGFRVDGPWDPDNGRRFNPRKLLLDPYALAISGPLVPAASALSRVPGSGRARAQKPDDLEAGSALDSTYAGVPRAPSLSRNDQDSAREGSKSVVVDGRFDWGDDRPPGVPWPDTVIYELHVKGFTQLYDEVAPELRGTYAGLGSPAVTGYLRDLGVTTVELLPVHQFFSEPALVARGLCNYWGYNSIGFFAPHGAYSSAGDGGEQVREFKEMVRALHAAGLEVVLDVVYNHTAEGDEDGPTLCFRGVDDRGYYKHEAQGTYWDITGCGNTVDAGHPPALRLILDSLRYWVEEMHVDGFRFDLAPALTRTGRRVDMSGPFISAIGQDPVLRSVKLIAEPWDASMDGYQVGRFPAPWSEWNDSFRNTARDFWRGRSGGIRGLASRLAGSSDLYADGGRAPYASVNFVTAHDGFTLRDLVTYKRKHNTANGEHNHDGTSDNRSDNCGHEGETDDPKVNACRRRRAANLMATLCLASGVPMITAGDERGRTQRGNNNAYAQDNEVSWVDWSPKQAWADMHELTRAALEVRRRCRVLRQPDFLRGRPVAGGGAKDLAWLHPDGRELDDRDWFNDHLMVLGMFLCGSPLRARGPRGERLHDRSLLLWFNGSSSAQSVALPEQRWFDEGEVLLSTGTGYDVGDPVRCGGRLLLDAGSVLVLGET